MNIYYFIDVDECADATTCDSNATCTNTPGSFTCTCNQGYTGNGTTCEGMINIILVCVSSHGILNVDIDECGKGDGNDCSSDATCTNTPGGYNCTCLHGYTGDGTTCTGKVLLQCFNKC